MKNFILGIVAVLVFLVLAVGIYFLIGGKITGGPSGALQPIQPTQPVAPVEPIQPISPQ